MALLFLSGQNLSSIIEVLNKETFQMFIKVLFQSESIQSKILYLLLVLKEDQNRINYLFSCYFCFIVWIFNNRIEFQLLETESLKKGEGMTKSQLIRDIAGNHISLENALLRLKIITYSLNNLSLQKWIENELKGYKKDDEIPQYRKDISYVIRYSGINRNFTVKSAPLSESFFTDETKKILKARQITDGIGTIERNLSIEMIYDLIELAPMVYTASKNSIQCYALEQVVNKASLENILNNVKIMLIDILLDLESKFGELDQLDIDVKCISSEELQTVNETLLDKIYYDGKRDNYE